MSVHSPWIVRLNRGALVLALVLLAALGAWWWRDRTRRWETPRWRPAEFARLAAPGGGAAQRWLVAINPECPHCRARLADLERRGAAADAGADLGALVVDAATRPAALDLPPALGAGVWWDSAGVWRNRWGHRTYGEALVFDADGRLLRVVPPSAAVETPAKP